MTKQETPAEVLAGIDKLIAENPEHSTSAGGFKTYRGHLIDFRDRLSRSLAAGKVDSKPWRWVVGDTVFESEAEAIEEVMQWGPSGSIVTPVYRHPVPPADPAKASEPDGFVMMPRASVEMLADIEVEDIDDPNGPGWTTCPACGESAIGKWEAGKYQRPAVGHNSDCPVEAARNALAAPPASAQQAGNPWDSIISEIQRRAESEGADERGSDFTVTISIGEYRKAMRTGSRGEGE